MKKRYRFLLTIVLVAVAFYFLWPSIKWYFLTPQADKDIAESSRNQIKVYAQEKADEVIKQLVALGEQAPLPAQYAFLAAKATVRYHTAKHSPPSQWTVRDVLAAYTSREDLAADIEGWYRAQMFALKDLKSQTMQLGLDLRGGMYVTIRADFASLEATSGTRLTDAQKDDKMKTTLEVLRNKIDQFGLTDPSIRRQGTDNIIIEIPGTSDPETVRRFIMGKGLLTFHIADTDALQKVREYQAAHPGVLLDAAGNVKDTGVLAVIPKGDVLRGVFQKDAYGLDELKGFTVLHEEVGLNGTEIKDAQVGRDPVTGEPTVNFILTGQGGETFYKLTSANVGKVLAVALDNKVKAQATISEPIRDQVRVTGFKFDEAQDLALVLRTGSLPGAPGDHEPAGHWSLAGPGRHQPGNQGERARVGACFRVHARLLPQGGTECGACEHPQPVLHRGNPFRVQLHAHPGRHRRPRAERGHGRGRERADLRKDQGGDAAGQIHAGRGQSGLRARVPGHRGLEHHHHHRGPRAHPAGQGSHPGLRGHPDRRKPRNALLRGIRFPPHL